MTVEEYHELRNAIDKLISESTGECTDVDGWFAYHCLNKDKEIKRLKEEISELYFKINKLKESK